MIDVQCQCGQCHGCPLCNPSLLSPVSQLINTPPSIQTLSFPQKGWVCPKCDRVYAPSCMECFYCNNPVKNGLVTT